MLELSPSCKQRLDQLLACQPSIASRSLAQRLIADKQVWVNQSQQKIKPSLMVSPPDQVQFVLPKVSLPVLKPIFRPLELHFEDSQLLVVHKPAGVCVHPSNGHFDESLVHYLLAHTQLAKSAEPLRPGIVHRLDKGTSGLLMVAKTTAAYHSLSSQLKQRTVLRMYLVLVHGQLATDYGVIQQPIGRDPKHRKKMAVVAKGRPAETHWYKLAQFPKHALLACRLKTGRTHQIRVHLKHLGHPVYHDPVYGRLKKTPKPNRLVAPQPNSLVAPQPNSLVASQPDSLVALRPDSLVAPQPNGLVAPQPNSPVALQPNSLVALQPNSPVALRPNSPVALQPNSPVALQPNSPVALQPNSPVALQQAPSIMATGNLVAEALALHACSLGFRHPTTQEPYKFLRKPPRYFQQWVQEFGGDWESCWVQALKTMQAIQTI